MAEEPCYMKAAIRLASSSMVPNRKVGWRIRKGASGKRVAPFAYPDLPRKNHATMKKCKFCAEDIQDAAIVCKHCGKDVAPAAVTKQEPVTIPAKQGYKWTLGRKLFAGFGVLFMILILKSCNNIISTDSPATAPATQPATPLVLDTAQNVPFEVAKINDFSIKAINGNLSDNSMSQLQQAPINKRKDYRIVVAPGITEIQAKQTINKLILDESKKDPDLDEIDVLVYDNKKDATSAYTVARGTWASAGTWGSTTPAIASTNNRNSYQVKYDFIKR